MRPLLFCLGLATGPWAQAQWSGSLALTSDRIERGVSQSNRQPMLSAQLGWRHPSGVSISLGASGVDREQYIGSRGYKLIPELGWASAWGGDDAWRTTVSLRGQYFPGARGPWFGNVSSRAQGLVARQYPASDYRTVELGGAVGWKSLTLSVTRSLTDYLGLATIETGPAGQKLIRSKGTVYVGLDMNWRLNDTVSLAAGVGRLNVPQFDDLDYTEWHAGVSARYWGLLWALNASSTNANPLGYRARAASDASNTASRSLAGSVAWTF